MNLQQQTICTDKGEIHLWKDKRYTKLLSKGLKKLEVNRKLVEEKLKTLHSNASIFHKENGAPIIQDHEFNEVSVSHSGPWFSLYFSNDRVGIDVQIFKESLFEGRSYFVNQFEEVEIELTLVNLHLIWGAKEAFYKYMKGEIRNLKEEVLIKEINSLDKIIALSFKNIEYKLKFDVSKDFVLVWI